MDYEYSMLPKSINSRYKNRKIAAFGYIVMGFLVSVLVTSFKPAPTTSQEVYEQNSFFGNVFLLWIALAAGALFVGLGYEYFLQRQRKKKIARFAAANNLEVLTEAQAFEELPGAFKTAVSGVTRNSYKFVRPNKPAIAVFEYEYSQPTRSNDGDYFATIAAFEVPNEFPHVFLDAKKGGVIHAYTQAQKVSLEGDFNNFYNVFSPDMANIELRQVFTPDIMQSLIDSGAEYDIELEGRHVALVAPGYCYSAERLPLLMTFAQNMQAELSAKSVRWGAIKEVAGHNTRGATSTMLKKYNYQLHLILLYIGVAIAIIATAYFIEKTP